MEFGASTFPRAPGPNFAPEFTSSPSLHFLELFFFFLVLSILDFFFLSLIHPSPAKTVPAPPADLHGLVPPSSSPFYKTERFAPDFPVLVGLGISLIVGSNFSL